jgi:ATP adenylyltransferase
MEHLWAPWRGEYIEGKKDSGCIFCAARDNGEGGLVLRVTRLSVVMLNKYPYNSGHLLVSPARHAARLEDLSDEEGAEIFRLLRHSTAALTGAYSPAGFNVGMNLGEAAGAGIVGHLHMHVVPRWAGDVNFMQTLGETKVISEHLTKTSERLRPYFERIP